MFSIIFLGLFQREQGSALLWRLSVSAVILRIHPALVILNRPRSSIVQKHMRPDKFWFRASTKGPTENRTPFRWRIPDKWDFGAELSAQCAHCSVA